MKPTTDITDPRVVKALAHPLRVRILNLLDERTASPSELADELGAPLGNVSYHVRQLASFGLIKLVKRTPRRGAIEHHYRAEPRRHVTDEAWSQVPEIVKQATIGAALAQVGDSVREAAAAGGFSPTDAHLSRTQLTLDAEGWQAVSQAVAGLLERVDEIQAETRERLDAQDHDGERRADLVLMLFESVEGATAPDRPAKGTRRTGAGRSAKRRTSRATQKA